MWRCALVLALAAKVAGFASEPAASEVEVPAAVREALERYVAEPTDANLQAVVDLQSDSGRASRSSGPVGCMDACAGYWYWKAAQAELLTHHSRPAG